MTGWNDGGWGMGTWVAMGLMMLLVCSAVIVFGVWIVRSVRSGGGDSARRSSPSRADEELAQRFARGEIDEAQYTRTRAILHGGDSRP